MNSRAGSLYVPLRKVCKVLYPYIYMGLRTRFLRSVLENFSKFFLCMVPHLTCPQCLQEYAKTATGRHVPVLAFLVICSFCAFLSLLMCCSEDEKKGQNLFDFGHFSLFLPYFLPFFAIFDIATLYTQHVR